MPATLEMVMGRYRKPLENDADKPPPKPKKPPKWVKNPGRGRGRIPTLTPAKQEAICKGIANGEPQWAAAGCAGVPTRTLELWLEKGRAADPIADPTNIYLRLVRAMEEAEAEATRFFQGVIQKAGKKGDVKAAIFWLQSRRRRDYPRHEMVEVTQRDFTDDDLTAIRSAATADEAAILKGGGPDAVALAHEILRRARFNSPTGTT